MHRRTVVTTAVTGVVAGAAGCLNIGGESTESGDEAGNETDDGAGTESGGGEAADAYEADSSYERCTRRFVPKNELPSESADEVESALEHGEYTAEELHYPALVAEDTILWDVDDNHYYTHRVDTDESTPTLVLEETTPSRAVSGEVKISNQTTETVDIDATISTADDVLVESELSVDPAENISAVESISNDEYAGQSWQASRLPGIEFPDEFRDYHLEVVIATNGDEHTETSTVSIHPWFEYYWVQVTDDEVIADPVWENDKLFTSGPIDSKMGEHWECAPPAEGWPEEQD